METAANVARYTGVVPKTAPAAAEGHAALLVPGSTTPGFQRQSHVADYPRQQLDHLGLLCVGRRRSSGCCAKSQKTRCRDLAATDMTRRSCTIRQSASWTPHTQITRAFRPLCSPEQPSGHSPAAPLHTHAHAAGALSMDSLCIAAFKAAERGCRRGWDASRGGGAGRQTG